MDVTSVTARHLREMVLLHKNTPCLQILWNRPIRLNTVRLRLLISFLNYITCALSVILIFVGMYVGIRYAGNTKNFIKLDDGEKRSMLAKKWVSDIGRNDSNDGPNLEKILERTKLKIKSESLKNNLTHSGENLEDLLMESGGRPIRSLIISTWRSGSTFLGEVLNAVSNTFYHYEPLAYYGVMKIRERLQAVGALRTIRNLFTCNYKNMNEYFNHVKTHYYLFNHNTELQNYCSKIKDLCLDANFTSSFCRLFPIQTMKLLRVRLHFIQELMVDKALNLKVVLLVRDPRGVMQSRTACNFCQWSPECQQPELLCSDMVSDYFAAIRLLSKYPDNFMILRYEELALNPNTKTSEILKFLNLSATTSVEKYLKQHTTIDGTGDNTTYKKSKDVPFKWKMILDFKYVARIQTVCKEAMDLWGYRLAHNATHMASHHFNPLTDFTITP